MNPFRTELRAKPSAWQIDHHSQVLLIGSCFSNNIGQVLLQQKFKVKQNPFGILYHPIAIANCLERIIAKNYFEEKELFEHNERFQHWDVHSDFAHAQPSAFLESINSVIDSMHQWLQSCSTLFITFGTAWVYEKDGYIVANCHKVPNKMFRKRLLTVDEISTRYKALTEVLNAFNPNCKIVFTLSPVRHLKDGFEENQVSKSTLRLAIQHLQERGEYFPSFEIMIDDLRDYRFYKDDLLHPNDLAVKYIWEQFKAVYFSEKTLGICHQIEQFNRSLAHRPFDKMSAAHRQFLQQLATSIQLFSDLHQIDFSKELIELQAQLAE